MNRLTRAGCLLIWLAALASLPAQATGVRWQLATQDAELRDVAEQMAAILDTTIVIDPRVRGKVTVLSDAALDRDGVRELFYSVLDAHGFAAVDEGERLLIVPATEAKGRAGQEAPGAASQIVTQVLGLQASTAADIAGLVRPLASPHGYVGPSVSANALVVTDSAANVERIATIVRQLDQGANQGHDVLTLKHGLAADLAQILAQSLGSDGPQQVIADPRANRLVLIGTPETRQRLRELASSLDVPATARSDNALVIRLRHGDAVQLAEILDGVGQRLGQPTQATGGSNPLANRALGSMASEVVVKADEAQNALVLMAEPGRLRTLQRIVEQLDQPRAQVLIHAAIVEISGSVQQALGVQWGGSSGSLRGGITFPGANIGLAGLLGATPAALPEGAVVGLGGDRFGALISALASDNHNNLLSTPSLLTLDNQQAEILVGQNVPFQTGSYTTSGNGADNPFTTVERKDIGISLKIKPHINEGSTLRLEVEQESSEVAPAATSNSRDLITNKRSLKSTILADDGEIIVIGGLIKDSIRQEQSGVPGLRKLPWVGGMFRWTREAKEKTNLMVFLRPTIVRGKQDVARFSQGSYEALQQSLEPGQEKPAGRPEAQQRLPETLEQLFPGAQVSPP
jgi:general secretion pathway protein D